MNDASAHLITTIDKIRKTYPDYRRGAYFFLYESVGYTARWLKRPHGTHLSAKDLLKGLRKMALEFYGPLAKEVLNYWGVFSCKDFGKIVEHLIEFSVLSKKDNDSFEDFVKYGFDFKEAFEI